MRAVVQRVASASIVVDGETVGAIERGLLVLLGVEVGDGEPGANAMADKIARLRVFQDDDGRMNRSVLDVGGGVLVVPNFTVAGDTRRGRRPSFDNAMKPPESARLYERVADAIEGEGVCVQRGVFGASMRVELVNEGPVTLLVEIGGVG